MEKVYKTLSYYPLAVSLHKRLVVVVGAGTVAQRKIEGLLEAGAHIRVVSPEIAPGLARLISQKKIKHIARSIQKRDLHGAYIIIAATDDSEVNERVSKWAREERTWVNVVDKPVHSDFISPAVFRNKKSIVTVYTDGKDPVLSRDLKSYIKERWDDFLSYRNRS